MAAAFTLTPELEDIRLRVRGFVDDVVKPGEDEIAATTSIPREGSMRISEWPVEPCMVSTSRTSVQPSERCPR